MSTKIKLYGILILVGFLAVAVVGYNVQQKTIKRLRDKNERLTQNMESLLDDNANLEHLRLSKDEVIGNIKRERDSLAEALKIRPKQIIRYIDRVITQHDTIIKEIPVKVVNDTTWLLNDSERCWDYKANVVLSDNLLSAKRLEFSYHNSIVDVFYWRRTFPIIGKKKFYQDSKPSCGSVSTKEIEFIKKK